MRIFKKLALFIIGLVILMVGLAYTVFFFKQDLIKNELLVEVNSQINGVLSIKKIGLNLFNNFPKATLKIHGAQLLEKREFSNDDDSHEQEPVLNLNNIHLTVDVVDLYNGKFIIEQLKLTGGSVNLTRYADTSLNLLNAIKIRGDTAKSEDAASFHLNSIEIQDIAIHYHNPSTKQYISTNINSTEATIAISGDSLTGKVLMDYNLDTLISDGRNIMQDHAILVEADFKADLGQLSFTLETGKIKFDLLEADLTGTYNYSDSGFVNINIAANHSDISDLSEMKILNPGYFPDIRGGRLLLNSTIYGKTIGQQPLVIASAKLSELHIHNEFGDVIEDSGFNLQFYSGVDKLRRDGMIKIDSIDLNFASGGFMKGNVEIANFSKPSYKVNWQLEESLEELTNIFVVPGIKEMTGNIKSQARLSGTMNLADNEFSNPEGILRVQFEDCLFTLATSDYTVKEVNGQFFMREGELSLDNFTFDANGNQLNISTSIENLVPYLLGSPTRLITDLSLHTHSLNTYDLLAFDSSLQKKVNYKIDSIDLVLKADFLSTDIDTFNVIPIGTILIENLTAKFDGLPLINKLKGSISITKDTLILDKMSGHVGDSPINLSLSMTNHESYFQTDSVSNISLSLDLSSKELIAKDFFTVNEKFLLPISYQEEVLNNVSINANISTTNFELQKVGLLPELDFQLTNLNFQTHFSPVKFKDISIYGQVKSNSVYINAMFGKFGRSDIFLNAEFNNVLATVDTVTRPFKSRIGLNSQLLDLDELVKLGSGDSDHFKTDEHDITTNPFADDYPITDLNVNIGRLEYYGAVIKNLSGILEMEDHNIIKLKEVRLESGEYGSFEFDGLIDASNHEEAILTSDIKILNVNLSKLNVTYLQNGKEVKIGDHLKGTFTGQVEVEVPISQDFSFDLNRLSGSIKAIIKDGALVNYEPLQQMGKYFKNKDLNNVYFADLMNTMIFDNGKMHLPFMTINTTLGTIFLMGYQTVDGEMEFDIKVPAKLIAGAVLNSLFASKKTDDDSEDQISGGPKGKYLTVHVYGKSDSYQFKIGKKHGVEPADAMD